ncbi:MAG: tRNA pseudouridine(55) synthase TruB [Desulfobacterales bacterium]
MTLLDGIVLLNKPAGMTSARLVAKVKSITQANKAGHTGTLDPAATGLMILCLNRGTRLAQFFLKGAKAYQGTLQLGVETDTQDAQGQVTATAPVPPLDATRIRELFKARQGKMEQLPPVHSALKHQGIPLYKLARRGTPVQKPARQVEIHALTLLGFDSPEIRFEVRCSAGTYVRTLCADIGRELGCGAHLKILTRMESSGFHLDQALSLEKLAQETQAGHLARMVVPLSRALPHLPALIADKVLTEKIKYGRMIRLLDLHPSQIGGEKSPLKIVDANDRLLAVVEWDPAKSQFPYRGVFVN